MADSNGSMTWLISIVLLILYLFDKINFSSVIFGGRLVYHVNSVIAFHHFFQNRIIRNYGAKFLQQYCRH